MHSRTICRICKRRCGIVVETDDNIVIKVAGDPDNERSRGYICPKGRAIPETVHSPDRLLHPARKRGDTWQTITWDDAYAEIAEKLLAVKRDYGPESFNIFTGEATLNERLSLYFERFGRIYGTPNHRTGGICHTVKLISNKLVYGTLLHPDYANARCIVLWGTNLDTAEPLNAIKVRGAVSNGAKLIVIDPALTPMAKKAGIHLRVRPGTDGALALGFMNVLIADGLIDKPFVDQWTTGFDQLAELAAGYTPEKVEAITWVPADQIVLAARLYGNTKPACIGYGNSVEHHSNAGQSMRGIAMLQALTGNVDIPGGGVFHEAIKLGDVAGPGVNNITAKAIGEAEHPVFTEVSKGSLGNMLADAILTGNPYPVKAVMVVGANPVLTYPNSLKMQRAFAQLDLLAVYDLFMTQTAGLADIVLPAAHFLERTELNLRDSDPIYCQQILLPPEEARSSFDLIKGLFQAMGYGDYFPWATIEESIDYRLKPTGRTIEELSVNPEMLVSSPHPGRNYEKAGFATQSGKVELFSEKLLGLGYNPLPDYTEPGESYYSNSQTIQQYPHMLTGGARIIEYYHSQFRNNTRLREAIPKPLVEINPQMADELGVGNGDRVRLETPRGSIETEVALTDVVHPKIMQMVEGWDEANFNILTDDEDLDPITGFPPLRSVMCRVTKVS